MEKSFVTLELPAVLNLLAAEAESGPGREEALRLQPSAQPEEVRRRLLETTDACRMMTLRGSPSSARPISPTGKRKRPASTASFTPCARISFWKSGF